MSSDEDHNSESSSNEDPTRMHMSNMVHFFPVTDEIYMCAANEKLYVCDMNNKILKTIDIEFNQDGGSDPQYFVPKLCKGKIYIDSYNKAYEWRIDSTTQLTEAKMYKNYVQVVNNKVLFEEYSLVNKYKVLTKNNKIAPFNKLKSGSVMSWTDLAFIEYEDKICSIESDFSEQFVCNRIRSNCHYFQAGIMLVSDQDKKCILIDAYTKTPYTVDKNIDRYSVESYLKPSKFGLTFADHFLVSVMGKQKLGVFLKMREQRFEEWRNKQFGYKDFPLEQVNNILKEVGRSEIRQDNIHMERFSQITQHRQLQIQVRTNKQTIRYLNTQISNKNVRVNELKVLSRKLFLKVVEVLK